MANPKDKKDESYTRKALKTIKNYARLQVLADKRKCTLPQAATFARNIQEFRKMEEDLDEVVLICLQEIDENYSVKNEAPAMPVSEEEIDEMDEGADEEDFSDLDIMPQDEGEKAEVKPKPSTKSGSGNKK